MGASSFRVHNGTLAHATALSPGIDRQKDGNSIVPSRATTPKCRSSSVRTAPP